MHREAKTKSKNFLIHRGRHAWEKHIIIISISASASPKEGAFSFSFHLVILIFPFSFRLGFPATSPVVCD